MSLGTTGDGMPQDARLAGVYVDNPRHGIDDPVLFYGLAAVEVALHFAIVDAAKPAGGKDLDNEVRGPW